MIRLIVYCKLILLFILIKSAGTISEPEYFNKNPQMERLVIKNQIAYHFKKVVHEIEQELFISRRIDTSKLFLGSMVLNQTAESLLKFCNSRKQVLTVPEPSSRSDPRYIYTGISLASFEEAKARCTALGLRLPEVMTESDENLLTQFLAQERLKNCMAGIEFDLKDSIFRFVSTGLPVWHGFYAHAQIGSGKVYHLKELLDDANVKYMYSSTHKLMASFDGPHPIDDWSKGHFSQVYRNGPTVFSELQAPVVCERKWNGKGFDNLASASSYPELTVNTRTVRSADAQSDNPVIRKDRYATADPIYQLCISIAEFSSEAHADIQSKLIDLLGLADIKVLLDDDTSKRRRRALSFVAKFAFKNGFKMIWGLLGFMNQLHLRRKIKGLDNRLTHLEQSSARTQKQVDENSKAITEMSKAILDNSIAIGQLQLATLDLDRRLNRVEAQVAVLSQLVIQNAEQIDALATLSLIENLVERIYLSLTSGYLVLKDIVHSSLKEQTSPLLLPPDQLTLVQIEVQRTSTSLIDPNFSRMQSIVVSDPSDPRLLLVIINAAAQQRRSLELVNIVPVPSFEGDRAYAPVVEYNSVLVDQQAQKFYILTPQEELGCLTTRCYVSDVERGIMDRSCGIPQWFNRQLDACLAEEVVSNGIFVKSLPPEGVIFSLKTKIDTHMFCKREGVDTPSILGTLDKMGVLHLPYGCVLLLIDKLGKTTKIRGIPVFKMIDMKNLDLKVDGPLNLVSSITDGQSLRNGTAHGSYVRETLEGMITRMEVVQSKTDGQSVDIWILVGIVISILILMIPLTYFIYNNSNKLRIKIKDLRSRLVDMTDKLVGDAKVIGQILPVPLAGHPLVGRRPVMPPVQLGRLRSGFTSPDLRILDDSDAYVNLNEARVRSEANDYLPLAPPDKSLYPELSLEKLELESKEVDELNLLSTQFATINR